MELTAAAEASGLTALHQYGIAGILLSILLFFLAAAIWYLSHHCEKRTEAALNAYKEDAQRSRGALENNTEALHGVQITLAKMDTKIDQK